MDPGVAAAIVGFGGICVGAVPATIAAVSSHRTSKHTKTSNGHTLAQLIELHIAQDSHNFDVLARRLGIPLRDLILPDDENPDT